MINLIAKKVTSLRNGILPILNNHISHFNFIASGFIIGGTLTQSLMHNILTTLWNGASVLELSVLGFFAGGSFAVALSNKYKEQLYSAGNIAVFRTVLLKDQITMTVGNMLGVVYKEIYNHSSDSIITINNMLTGQFTGYSQVFSFGSKLRDVIFSCFKKDISLIDTNTGTTRFTVTEFQDTKTEDFAKASPVISREEERTPEITENSIGKSRREEVPSSKLTQSQMRDFSDQFTRTAQQIDHRVIPAVTVSPRGRSDEEKDNLTPLSTTTENNIKHSFAPAITNESKRWAEKALIHPSPSCPNLT